MSKLLLLLPRINAELLAAAAGMATGAGIQHRPGFISEKFRIGQAGAAFCNRGRQLLLLPPVLVPVPLAAPPAPPPQAASKLHNIKQRPTRNTDNIARWLRFNPL